MANRNYPKNSTATTVIPFDNPVTAIPQKTITGATTFTKSTTGAQAGYCAMIRVVANGSNVPDLSAFKSIGTGTWDNTNGVVNQLWFVYDGTEYCVAITHPGTIVGGGGGGDTTPPSTTSVTVENAEPNKVLIAYGETLDSGSVPATSAYTVKVNGTTRTVSAVAITGANVKVTFGGAAVVSTDTITLDYVVPGTSPIQDAAGNDAAALTAVTVGNNVAGTTDADANAYIAALVATGETVSSGRQAALQTFFAALKTGGVWTKITEAYIQGWSTYAACRIGIKGAFPYTITGGTWAFSTTTGTTPDNDQAAFTNIIPASTPLLQDDCHIGIYSLNSSQTNTYDAMIGAVGGSNYLQIMTSGGNVYADVNGGQTLTGALALAAAFDIADRADASTVKVIRNGSVALSVSDPSTGLPTTYDITIGLSNPSYHSNRPWFYATIGKSVAAVASAYNTAVQDLKTAFGI
jgi:hypothetical protein